MNFVIISSDFKEKEQRLLAANVRRIQAYINSFKIIYAINEFQKHIPLPEVPHTVFLSTKTIPQSSSCAAANRLAGLQYLLSSKEHQENKSSVVFIDGDMLLTRPYLKYIKKWVLDKNDAPCLLCSDRVDIRYDPKTAQVKGTRLIRPQLNRAQQFKQIYGAFAIKNINPELMLMTYDNEEQWFLTMCKIAYKEKLICTKYNKVGVLHFDKWSGTNRITRIITSPRGIGFWQGLFSFKYGLRNLYSVIFYNSSSFMLLTTTLLLSAYHPLLSLLPLLYPKSGKKITSLVLGLIKTPFHKTPQSLVYKKI